MNVRDLKGVAAETGRKSADNELPVLGVLAIHTVKELLRMAALDKMNASI